jgi:glucan phosphoethanolaminetransferase (alkaline phosphatase superfamily)
MPTAKKERDRVTNNIRAAQQTKGRDSYNKKTSAKKRNTIIIIGESHARGCDQEI